MASKTYFFKFESREECYKICRSVGYCFTDSVTGDTVMDVPGAGHIDVAGRFYDPENIIWESGFHLNVVIKDEAEIPKELISYQIEVKTPNLNSQ